MLKFGVIVFLLAIATGLSFAEDRISNITSAQVRGVGESVDLSCTVEGDVSPFWLKKSRDHVGDPNILSMGEGMAFKDPRFKITKVGNTYTLSIKDIVVDDNAFYECLLVLGQTRKETAEVELSIRRAPVVTNIEITPSPAPENNSAVLKCFAEGFPRPTIYWSRENDRILPKGSHSVASVEYRIDSVSREDRGLYYCEANNGVGKPNRRSVNFEVEFGPIISVPRPKVAQAVGYGIELICRVEAYPAPSVVWFKDDVQIYDDSDYSVGTTATINEVTTSVLHVNRVNEGDYGDYVCKASNKISSAEARVNLFQQKTPNINFSGLQWNGSSTVFQPLQYILNYIAILMFTMIFV